MSWLEDLLMQGGAFPQQMALALQGRGMKPDSPTPDTSTAAIVPDAPASEPAPPTNDHLARDPIPHLNGAPLPRPRPTTAGIGQVDEPSAPMSLAPPDQAANPPNATPTVGTAPTVNQSPPSGPSGILGKIFDPANAPLLLAMGGGFAGAPSFGTGMRRGLSAAAPQAALLRQEQLKLEPQNATYKALIAKGIPDDIARAASTNKDLMAQLIPQVFGAKQFQHVTIKDRMGNEIPLSYDPSNKKYFTATGEPYGTPNASGVSSVGDPNKAGQEYLDTLDPMTRNEVKAFGEGRAPVTARNLQQMLPLVTQAYPGFQASQYPVMMATRKSYTSGKDFQETQALNTVSGHMLKLSEAAQNLPNTTVPILNKGMNWFADTFTGSPELTKFRNALVTTSNELAKAYHGGHVSDASYSAFQKGINEAQTPAEMKAAIGEISGLLKSKIEAKESGYRSSMGDAPLPSEFKATNDEARHAFEKINDWALGIKPNAEKAPTAVAPQSAPQGKPPVVIQNGHRYELQPDGSYK